jgi:predicted DNA-binding ribbon-helix-helix protein
VSTLVSRNVSLADRRTSIRLEPEMWDALHEICAREGRSLHDICTEIDRQRGAAALTASVRVFILNYFRAAATEEGHALAALRRSDAPAPPDPGI